MAKNAPPPAAQSNPAFWLSYVLVGICGLCIGITGTYIVLSPHLHPTAAATAAAPMLPQTAGTFALPPAGLTSGMSPAQADRTLGNFYYDQSNWPQAIRYYESAIKQGSDDADIRTDLGNAYQFAGRAADALAEYQRAQQMNPQHEFSLFNQGGLYLDQMHDAAKAIAIWNEYLRRFPAGRNAAFAQQLLAQAQAHAAAGVTPEMMQNATVPAAGAPANAPADSTEQRLFQLVSPAKPAAPVKP